MPPASSSPTSPSASVAAAEGDRAALEAAVDAALGIDPDHVEALNRKAALQFERGDLASAAETFGRIIARAPGDPLPLLRRGEVLMRSGDFEGARRDVAAALRLAPAMPVGLLLDAMLKVQARDFQGADQALQRIPSQTLVNLPDGLLVLATVKRALGQTAQAEDAAQRHVARRPDDPRGAKLLATLEMERGAPDAAAGTLARLVQRGRADAEAFDMLGRAHAQMRRRTEAREAFERAAELAPDDPGILTRLAVARLAVGEAAGAAEAARAAIARAPDQRGAREVLASAALALGDLDTARAELDRLGPEARQGELAGIVEATIRLIRLDLAGAKERFEAVLRTQPDSVRARLGLARIAAIENDAARTERLLGEVLERDPENAEALRRIATAAGSGAANGASALALLERTYAANPTSSAVALALASAYLRLGQPAKAVEILDSPVWRDRARTTQHLIVLAEARAQAGQMAEAEAAARAALAQEPRSSIARRQVATLLARRNDIGAAEAVLQQGLRMQPADGLLQQGLVELVRDARGLDAALALADTLARQRDGWPASLALRGNLLMAANRIEEAAAAYEAGYRASPSAALAQAQAGAWQAAGRLDRAAAALKAWLEREPEDLGVHALLSQIEILQGETAAAETRLRKVVAARPDDGVSANNLAWLMQARADSETEAGRAMLAEALRLAERAYFVTPTPETADTLGWILFRTGRVADAMPFLRQAAAGAAQRPQAEPGIFVRFAQGLAAIGSREEAMRVLEPIVAADLRFAERAEAEALLARLRAAAR
ncbi:MAG: PEP-CTERM system TPR-repeat protein PrsT [Acetobacteraceae bacterium]|nr:PEP-CTERM system TPR-repeat protein PrsT [Acetobacteraceae bacterium]